MNLQEQNILFFTRTMGLGGTENIILELCEILKPYVNKIVVCSCGGVNVSKLEDMGILHVNIKDIENKSISTLINTAIILKKIIKDEEITIIHTHHRMAAFYVSLLKMYKKCVFINTSHNTFKDKKKLTYWSYKHANLIACGEMVKKNLVSEYKLQDQNVTVIRNGIRAFDKNEIVQDSCLKRLHLDGNFIVGNIGRLSKQKGMEYFIRAIPEVVKKYPNIRFVIAGEGEDEDKLKALSKMLNIDKYLLFLGYRSDVQNLISQLDLVVISSLWEGLPLIPIETFSVEKTIIATAVDGTIEIVQNEKNGLLVKEKDSRQIADKIIWMVENQKARETMQKCAFNTYKSEFSIEKFGARYINYYKKVLKKRSI